MTKLHKRPFGNSEKLAALNRKLRLCVFTSGCLLFIVEFDKAPLLCD